MTFSRPVALACGLALTLLGHAAAQAVEAEPADLTLEELLQADVQTAARKPQRLQDVAAAVFLITREDIERSGATSIPDALRLAPGVQVARMANDRWAVTARGFNGRFANKLLVLMDGRSLYSPLFSGVLWETEDTLLEDIDHIEVIRGPGAALWGSNAVNGVINIITRKARDTRGTLAVASAGSEQRGTVELRHGLAAGDGSLRLWAKASTHGASVDAAGQPGNDAGGANRIGFRGDWNLGTSRRLTVSGAAYESHAGDRWNLVSYTSPSGAAPTDIRQKTSGGHVLARHEWIDADGSDAAVQAYFDHSHLDEVDAFHQQRDTVDLDFQIRPRLGGAHDVVWGGGYRESRDQVGNDGVFLVLTPPQRSWRLASLFVQDEITLRPERLHLVLGTRLEHNNFTGFEPQPNARLVWTPTAQQTLWTALSRAVRTPSRAEQDAQVDLALTPSYGVRPAVLTRNLPPDDHHLDNEVVKAFELGYRQQFGTQLSLDVALFDNHYTRLRGGVLSGAPTVDFAPVLHVVQAIMPSNSVRAHTQGVELALDWHVSRNWRIQPAYTYLRIDATPSTDDPVEASSAAEYNASAPRHQLSLRSSTSLPDRSQIDLWLRHVTALGGDNGTAISVPAYTTLDLRWARRLLPGVELSVVGQNLLESRHLEFAPDLIPSQTLEVQRALLVSVKWQF